MCGARGLGPAGLVLYDVSTRSVDSEGNRTTSMASMEF
jgi:hypothetical protein